MTSQTLRVVQFVHPGFEYHRQEHVGPRGKLSGVMVWKPGRSTHDRKFMLARGSLFDWDTGRDHESALFGFWGEWEGPSVFWRVESPGKPLPKIVHAPFRPANRPTESVQNTDPMVFGDAFIYSNCLQGAYRSLRTLSRGSIVLFGRFSRSNRQPSFGLDTCLVVDRVRTLAPAPTDDDSYGTDLLKDAVLSPLHSERAERDLTVYFGQRRSSVATRLFSFFPARLMKDSPPLFARPELRPIKALQNVISPGNMQGIKVTSHLSVTDSDEIWTEVVKQVTQQGFQLGYYASPPPVLERHVAKAAAERTPMPFSV